MNDACCTCATLLSNISPLYDEKTEKPISHGRRLPCCNRVICGNCIHSNARFASYCPFCQVSTNSSSIPQGLREPPSYSGLPSALAAPPSYTDELPSYNSLSSLAPAPAEKQGAGAEVPTEDVLHFLDHGTDTIASLSLKYGVAIAALRRKNGIMSDHLLLARRTVLIPGEFYKGEVSLSPRPVEGEEEEARKARVRRFMVANKISEYDVAILYLEQAEYDIQIATEAFQEDERWEKDHPLKATINSKGKMHDAGRRRFTDQR